MKALLLPPLHLGGRVPRSGPTIGPSQCSLHQTSFYEKSRKVKCQWDRQRRKTRRVPCPAVTLTLILALGGYYLALVSLKAPFPAGVLVPHLLDREIIPMCLLHFTPCHKDRAHITLRSLEHRG